MKRITHPYYADYPEQPYISPDRNLIQWEERPEKFPYGKVEKRQMIRTEEGLFPGDIVMLWRIHFGNFTTDSTIPEYFEYRYGINSDESIERLIDGKFIEIGSAKESVDLLNMTVLKRILKSEGCSTSGNKGDLVNRVLELSEETLNKSIDFRRYIITKEGRETLEKHGDIIKRHGPKK